MESQGLQTYENKRVVASSEDAELQSLLSEIPEVEGSDTLAPREDEDEGKSFGDHLTGMFGSAAHGVVKSFQEMGNLGIEASNSINKFLVDSGYSSLAGRTDRELIDWADNPKNIHQPDGTAEHLISGVANFLAPMGLLNKATKGVKAASKMGKFAKAGALGAAVDFSAFDPDENRLSNLVETVPELRNPITQFLATNPKDTRAEGRFKNAIEGLGIGIAFDALLSGVKAYRARRVSNNVMKDTEELVKGVEAKGVEIPKADAEIPEEVAKVIDETKAEVKAKRPTQDPQQLEMLLDENLVESNAETLMKKIETSSPKGLAANIDLDNLNSPKEIKKTIKAVAETFSGTIDEARRGTMTQNEIAGLADDLGMTTEDLLSRSQGQAFNAEEILASRKILNNSAENLYNLAKQIAEGNDSKIIKAEYLDAIDLHRNIQSQVSGAVAESGRALMANKKAMQGLTGSARARYLEDIVKNGGDVEKMAEAMVEGGGSTKNITQLTKRSWGRKMKDAAMEGFVNNLLSGPMTHIVNMGSNALTAVSSVAERRFAESFSRGSIDSVAKGEAEAMMNGMVNSIGDAFRMAGKTFKNKQSAFRQSKAYEMTFENAISSEAFGISSDTVLGKSLDVFGQAIGLPTRALEASDEFFKAINFRAEVYAQAHRRAMRDKVSKSLSESQFKDAFEYYIKNPDESIKSEALNNARERTFTKPLSQVKTLGYNASTIDAAIKNSPALRVVAPFTKTNLNLVEYALNRTPLPIGQLRSDIAAGGLRKDMALARVSFGMTTLGLGASLSYKGVLSGRGPTDRRARLALEGGGWKPYSIKVGDTFYRYDRLDPFGSLLGIAADTSEIIHAMGGERDVEAQQLAVQMGSVIAQFLAPEFITKNVNDFIDIVNGDERKLDNFLGGIARGVVPFSSAAKMLRAEVDPVDRDRRGDPEATFPIVDRMLNEIRNTIPGLSDSLPPKRNMWGEAKTFMTFVTNPDDEAPFDDDSGDSPIMKEFRRLNSLSDSTAKDYLKIDMPQKYIRKSLGGQSFSVKLSPEEYDKYVQLSAGIGLTLSPFPGRTLKEVLDEQAANDYPLLNDAPRNDETKILLIKEIISQFRKGAREQLLMESSDIQQDFINQAMERASRMSGQNVKFNL